MEIISLHSSTKYLGLLKKTLHIQITKWKLLTLMFSEYQNNTFKNCGKKNKIKVKYNCVGICIKQLPIIISLIILYISIYFTSII